jgi:hypothetical protein
MSAPDDPGIVALATRIERAMRGSVTELRNGDPDYDLQMERDRNAIHDRFRAYDHSVPIGVAARSARIHWLADVLAGAMGGAEQPRPKGGSEPPC